MAAVGTGEAKRFLSAGHTPLSFNDFRRFGFCLGTLFSSACATDGIVRERTQNSHLRSYQARH